MTTQMLVFLGLVFATVVMLFLAMAVPIMGAEAASAKRMRSRIHKMTEGMSEKTRSLLRERYLKDLSPLERTLEGLPQMTQLARLLEQTGIPIPAYRYALLMAGLGVVGFLMVLLLFQLPLVAVAVGAGLAAAPVLAALRRRDQRLEAFEAQLPEALNMITRGLRAGLPFTDTLKIVGDEMPDPIAREINVTHADINYGIGMRDGLISLLTRVPSMSLTAVVTAVLVQRETGGNLAEILDKIAAVVRSRFRLNRRIRTLSAEGRMSAWVLGLVPFLLAAALFVTTPSYLPQLVNDPLGPRLILYAFILVSIGIFWVRRVIRIRV